MPAREVFNESALEGQRILITGGAGALGVAITQKLTAHGARVAVNDVLEPEIGLERLKAAGVDLNCVAYVRGDITREASVEAMVERAREQIGEPDTVLCHAGTVSSSPLLDVDEESWDRQMAVNLKGAFLVAKTAARRMLEQDRRGHLIFTSSWVSETPWPSIGPYNASKAGLNQLMRSFARELAPFGVRANAIAPGIVAAGMAKQQWDTEPDYRARAQRAIPLGEMQSLDSVADAFLFLCSDAASYMTGSVLVVDGGCSLYPMD